MQRGIKKQILRECEKLIQRHHMRVSQRKKYEKRYAKRTGGVAATPASYEPQHWALHPHFNPFYVRARIDSIAHSITQKIRNRQYQPNPALCLPIPKPGGGHRTITIFPIPDAAVSSLLFHSLRGRNQQFFSSYAYAYRGDRSVHHAVQHLYRYVKGTARVFALNYDFSKYFDSIDHEYLVAKLQDDFHLSAKEHAALASFLSYRKAEKQDYLAGNFTTNSRGVPQGSSISLFLANVACLDLDIELEREGAVFARYADDTIILCSSYEMAHRCANRMLAHGTRSRTEINFAKSEGIFLVTPEPRGEMRAARHFDFLGNRISQTNVTIAAKSVKRIKRRISGIIHRHLLFYPKKGSFSTNRIGPNSLDWDLVTCINEIRRYLYGSVSDADLTAALTNPAAPLRQTLSLLSYYPLVDDPTIFRQLDGWLIDVIRRGQRERKRHIDHLVPGYRLYTKQEIISGSWYVDLIPNETRLPSFFHGWIYVRKLLDVFGAAEFPVPDYES